jgi:hypothetical protein
MAIVDYFKVLPLDLPTGTEKILKYARLKFINSSEFIQTFGIVLSGIAQSV